MIGTPSCPHCSGSGQTFVHVNRGGDGAYGSWEHQPCRTCAGTGLIDREHAGRIAEGERRREDRKARGLSLREEAARLGMKPWGLSDIENGREPRDDYAARLAAIPASVRDAWVFGRYDDKREEETP